ncbi:hypothetical protein Hanom_Chr11g01013841 [Helianthus anomalus]
MKLVELFLLEHEDALDPTTNKPCTTLMWPPTKKKTVPLLKELHDNSLKDWQFCMCDPVIGQAVIVCENVKYRLADTNDLTSFGENDIKL